MVVFVGVYYYIFVMIASIVIWLVVCIQEEDSLRLGAVDEGFFCLDEGSRGLVLDFNLCLQGYVVGLRC